MNGNAVGVKTLAYMRGERECRRKWRIRTTIWVSDMFEIDKLRFWM